MSRIRVMNFVIRETFCVHSLICSDAFVPDPNNLFHTMCMRDLFFLMANILGESQNLCIDEIPPPIFTIVDEVCRFLSADDILAI